MSLSDHVQSEPSRRASRTASFEMRRGCHSMIECKVHGDECNADDRTILVGNAPDPKRLVSICLSSPHPDVLPETRRDRHINSCRRLNELRKLRNPTRS